MKKYRIKILIILFLFSMGVLPVVFAATPTVVDSKKAAYITSPQGLKGLKSWQIWKDPNSNRLYHVLASTSRQAQTIKAELDKIAQQPVSAGTLSPMTINNNIGTYIPNAQELSKLKSWQIWKDPNNNRLYHLKAKTAQEAQKVKNNLEAGTNTTQKTTPETSGVSQELEEKVKKQNEAISKQQEQIINLQKQVKEITKQPVLIPEPPASPITPETTTSSNNMVPIVYNFSVRLDTNDLFNYANANYKCGLNLGYNTTPDGGITTRTDVDDEPWTNIVESGRVTFSTFYIKGDEKQLNGLSVKSLKLRNTGTTDLSKINLNITEGSSDKLIDADITFLNNEATINFTKSLEWPKAGFFYISFDPSRLKIGETLGLELTSIDYGSTNDNTYKLLTSLPAKSGPPTLAIKCQMIKFW
ncbi:MAG: hypothetical protein A3H70_01060 [Candidatus Komeilibacteria bacterium RIFCSPLOWO2_02_FULL_48_11]|uniref:Uncharacterized protein n=1 Tax=Candidatus Komeilibacteria bacterium RIFCSPLOWO2_02_FULL_48_11 TaxID=1798553 RepID=A0A1G2BSD5_9BACT|nr:MAG: hypothetical protein A3H70_01060 [Candidatus Komeilibacteria bacterium RIFCSPLOWO2_02_FULL_48_11]